MKLVIDATQGGLRKSAPHPPARIPIRNLSTGVRGLDDILRLRYVEIGGQSGKVMVVIKMRGGNHRKDIRENVIIDKRQVVIYPRSAEINGLITGILTRTGPRPAQVGEPAPEPKATK